MDHRLVQFIAHLRAGGVPVSLAETLDAGRALLALPALSIDWMRAGLKATLIKQKRHQPLFNRLFDLYFRDVAEGDQTAGLEAQLRPAMRTIEQFLDKADDDLKRLLDGEKLTFKEIKDAVEKARRKPMWGPITKRRRLKASLSELDLDEMDDQIAQLVGQLRQDGLPLQEASAIQALLDANRHALTQQVRQFLDYGESEPPRTVNLVEAAGMNQPFDKLSEVDLVSMRRTVHQLGLKLSTRTARRYKRGRGGRLNVKATMRRNLATGGVPMRLYFERKRKKPRLVAICDISTSMRPVAQFLLQLIYELQGQLVQVRSFAFNDRLVEISKDLTGRSPGEAIPDILTRIKPQFYTTDTGQALTDFWEHHLDAANRYTTVIILGDARNNGRAPKAELLAKIQRRVHRLVWFNPEPREQWADRGSDMPGYEPVCDAVHQVHTLAELEAAVDQLFAVRN